MLYKKANLLIGNDFVRLIGFVLVVAGASFQYFSTAPVIFNKMIMAIGTILLLQGK